MIGIYQGSLDAFDVGMASGTPNLGVAQAGVDAAQSQSEKDDWLRWQNLYTTEYNRYKDIATDLHAKQAALEAEKSQLEASLIANCGGLDVTEGPMTNLGAL